MAKKVKVQEPLLSYQQKAIDKAMENDGSVLLSMPMGTGKTRTAVEIVEALRKSGKASKTLVVVPASLRTNFHEQGVKRWGKGAKSQILGSVSELHPDIYDSKLPKSDYYVVSYNMFSKDPDLYIDRIKPDTLVIDEIHNYRNEGTKNLAAMRSARSKVRNMIGLTGTPFNNEPADIHPLIDLVSGGKHELGASREDFKRKFIGGNKIKDFKGHTTGGTHLKATRQLQKELQKWTYHLDESEAQAGEKPSKIVEDVLVEMSPEQKIHYDFVMRNVPSSVRRQIREGLPASRKEAFHILPMLGQARAVSNSMAFLDKERSLSRAWQDTPKTKKLIDDVVEHVNAHPKNQAILHSHLVNGGIDVLEAGLKDRKIPYAVISGGIKQVDRDAAVANYNAGKIRAIVLSSAGTTGLNLPNTTGHFSLDGHYNPAVNEQIEARGIRAGGQSYRPKAQRRVIVKRYKSVYPQGVLQRWGLRNKENSVDEWIEGIAHDKTEINAQAEALLKKTAKSVWETLKERPGQKPEPSPAVDYIRKYVRDEGRLPLSIGPKEDGTGMVVRVESGDRALLSDFKRYSDNRDFRRNALIGAIGLAAFAAGSYKLLKDPQAIAKFMAKAKKPAMLDQFLGTVGPTTAALGALGLMNEDCNVKTDLALLAGGALATYKASRGDTRAVPSAIRAIAFGAPVMGAGLTYAGREAEKIEDRKNIITQVMPAARYYAPHKVLALAEGHTIGSLREHLRSKPKTDESRYQVIGDGNA